MLHAVERLHLEGVDGIHRVVNILERTAQCFQRNSGTGCLFMNKARIVAQQLTGAVDDIRGRRVERGNLVQNQFLVRHRLRHGNCCTQCANGGGRCTVNALDQFDIVLFDQIKRKITLHRHRHLRQQILRTLAHIEQRAFLYRARLGGVGQFKLSSFFFQFRIQLLGHDNHLFQLAHGNPQILPLNVDRGIVHQQLILAIAKTGQNRTDMRLRTLVAVEIIAKFVAEWDDAKQLLLGHQIALFGRVQIFNNAAQFGEICADAGTFIHAANGLIKEAVRLRRCFHNFLAAHVGQLVHALPEFRAVHILRDQVSDIGFNALRKLALLFIRHRNQAHRLLRRDGWHGVGRRQLQLWYGLGNGFSRHR